tara:strand:+ start:673 stop:906 length:234 start_codon:yes stop_codon:yes gene_type:complete
MFDNVLIPAIMSLFFSGIIGIISQIQHSRCSEINCCGCRCVRKVPEEEQKPVNLANVVSPREIDLENNIENNNTISN